MCVCEDSKKPNLESTKKQPSNDRKIERKKLKKIMLF